jgi:hypothetical protein
MAYQSPKEISIMNKKAAELPDEMRFILDVVAHITLGTYESALRILIDGARKLVLSPGAVSSDDLIYAITAFENSVQYKLATSALNSGVDAPISESSAELWCRFCGKGESDVKQLIAGAGVFICDGCVGICNEILDEKTKTSSTPE